jgi:GNAT superfamily N-acetyltransferase
MPLIHGLEATILPPVAPGSTAPGFGRAAAGLGEALGALGRHGAGAHEVRRPDAVGAEVAWAADNHWIDAAVVPVGATPPADDPSLPHCLWIASGERADGRTELPGIAMPVMTLDLVDVPDGRGAAEAVPIGEIGVVNDRAYGGSQLGSLIGALPPTVGRAYAVRGDGGRLASVAAAIDLGTDVSVQWVATDPAHRRRGLGTQVMRALLGDARRRGLRTASLQASPDGLPLYRRLGFTTVGFLHAHVR